MELNLQLLEKWRAETAREIADIEEQLRPLHAAIQRRREQLAAIDRLADLIRGESQPSPAGAGASAERTNSLLSLGDTVYEVLQKEGSPLHYREIARRFSQVGIPIPGEKPEANLIAHMSRDKRFVRVARGTYALSSWNMKPAPRMRRRRERK